MGDAVIFNELALVEGEFVVGAKNISSDGGRVIARLRGCVSEHDVI